MDFPAPFGPRKPRTSPRGTVKLMSSTAIPRVGLDQAGHLDGRRLWVGEAHVSRRYFSSVTSPAWKWRAAAALVAQEQRAVAVHSLHRSAVPASALDHRHVRPRSTS